MLNYCKTVMRVYNYSVWYSNQVLYDTNKQMSILFKAKFY